MNWKKNGEKAIFSKNYFADYQIVTKKTTN
jgi:hypothetical protein